jgi:hypothetical protein
VLIRNPAIQESIIEKPIFIVGTGRCGSTALHHVLASHPVTAWFSRLCDTRPHEPYVNRWALHVLDLPFLERFLRKLIYPVEAYRLWDHYCPGFSEPCRDLLKEDVTPHNRSSIRYFTAKMLTARRCRLLVKITGWPRIGFLKEVFPDARFIHIYRDGRAVANSYLSTSWWSGWRGPAGWRWGELPLEYRQKLERHNQSFVALAAIQWSILMDAQKKAKQELSSNNLLEIRYEDMCKDPVGIFHRATEFTELEWSARFQFAIQARSFVNTNYKWQHQLSAAQQGILHECLGETLREYDYV